MKVGDIIATRKQAHWHDCQVCGLPASYRITYLLARGRANPVSTAYGKDDCSWCSDAEAFACKRHEQDVKRDLPIGMNWCATFPLKKFRHMGFYYVGMPE